MTISRRQFVAGVALALAVPTTAIAAKKEINKDFYGYGSGVIKFKGQISEQHRNSLIWALRPKEGIIEFEFSTKPEHEETIKRMTKDFLDKHADEYQNYIVSRKVENSQDNHLVTLGRMREVVTVEHILRMGSAKPPPYYHDVNYEDFAKIILYNKKVDGIIVWNNCME